MIYCFQVLNAIVNREAACGSESGLHTRENRRFCSD
ncbi:hypothetical protein COPEUT_00288 [Coprococcus eutactus ATCC 27759]|nr:hypothetical protein COPEUT_00288 [Coprococcus eutactus ATCC 27759]